MHVVPSHRTSRSIRWSLLVPALGLSLWLAGCSGNNVLSARLASHPVGALIAQPDPSIGSRQFVVDENSGGSSGRLTLVGMAWGRLVKVRDQLGVLQQTDMLVGEDIVSDGIDFDVNTNSITLDTTVTILHPYSPSVVIGGVETSSYQRAFRRLDLNLTPIGDKSLAATETPPYPLIPRNATIVLRFNDLLDPELVNSLNVKLLVGYPPTIPVVNARILPDINHGDTRGNIGAEHFYTTRILVDPAVTPLEAASAETTLSPNVVGLPPSVTQNQPNVAIRIPTRLDSISGQNSLLRNISGSALAFSGNGSNDSTSATRDIVRAARSGGKSAITGDVNNGFLADSIRPKIVGTQGIAIGTPTGGPTDFVTTITFLNTTCALPAKVGDVIQQPGVFAEVTAAAVPIGNQIAALRFRVVFPTDGIMIAGPATLSTVWDPIANQTKQACFVRFPSITTPPNTGVATESSVIVRFNEPMDPDSLSPFESFRVNAVDPSISTPTFRDFVVSKITGAPDSEEFQFAPIVPFKHVTGNAEPFWVNIASGAGGPLDLAGNPLSDPLPPVRFTLDPTGASRTSGNAILRFTSADEIGGDGLPEVRGQVQLNFVAGQLEPRPVVHFSAPIDRGVATVANMTITNGQQTPLSRLGSKLMTVWRYCDAGFVLLDESRQNLDVEGLAWSPSGGGVVADTFGGFQISLAHSTRLPDEGNAPAPPPGMGVITFPASGLRANYNENLLSLANDPLKVVHARSRGYTVRSSDRFSSVNGTVLMPFPLNRGIPTSDFKYYTWRDTAILNLGGANSAGAEMAIVNNLTPLLASGTAGNPFPAGSVPTIALPLLMEFRCYPDNSALGLNLFDVSLVTANNSFPSFRAFSTGGVATGGIQTIKDPDLEGTATGGFNPTTGAPDLSGVDNTFYIGQMNLVSRISRAHTVWFDATGVTNPRYAEPVFEPAPEDQPTGTSIVLAFRGATNVPATAKTDAGTLNAYGNVTGAVTFLNGDATWKSTMSGINSATIFQTRISFVGNAETNLTPVLSAIGFAYQL